MLLLNSSMTSFTLAGLPLTDNSISNEFAEFINQDTPTICLLASYIDQSSLSTSLDYNSAKSGFDFLFNSNYEFYEENQLVTNITKCVVMFPGIWYSDGQRKKSHVVAKTIIEKVNQLSIEFPQHRIVYISPGSPYLYDGVCEYLIDNVDNISVIDTTSSAQLTYDLLDKLNLTNGLLPNIINDLRNINLEKNKVNVLGCVSNIYNNHTNLETFIDLLDRNYKIYAVTLTQQKNIVNEIAVDQLKYYIENNINLNITVALIPKDIEE